MRIRIGLTRADCWVRSSPLYKLRKLHEAVLGGEQTPAKDTFRRTMEPHLEETGRILTGTVGNPVMLYHPI